MTSDDESGPPSEQIDAIIEDLPGWKGEVLSRIRGLIVEADTDVVEEISGKNRRTRQGSRFGNTPASSAPVKPSRTR